MRNEVTKGHHIRIFLATAWVLGCLGALGACSAASPGQEAEVERHDSSLAAAQPRPDKGSEIFRVRCSGCHHATTTTARVGPGLKGLFQRDRLSRLGLPATEGSVRRVILKGSGSMPPLRGVLTDAELADLIAYLKTL